MYYEGGQWQWTRMGESDQKFVDKCPVSLARSVSLFASPFSKPIWVKPKYHFYVSSFKINFIYMIIIN